MVDSPGPRIEFVSQYELNAAFESMLAHYVQREIALDAEIVYDRLPNQSHHQPFGTRSIVEKWLDPASRQLVAVVHYYLLADCVSIGASGKKDPKRVIWKGVDYQVRQQKPDSDG